MNSGTISYNEAKHTNDVSNGGGIFILRSASFTMNDGTISNNKSIKNSSAVSYGGGVCIKGNGSSGNHAKFIFKGGSITSNTANYGGGVQMTEGGIFEMGGTSQIPSITGNTASPGNGGGIFLWSSRAGQISLDMSGGLIQGNTAADKGKGICFFLGSGNNKLKMKMSGTAKVDSNNDVYLHSVNTITVDESSFTPQGGGKAATITPENYSAGRQVLSGTALGTEHGKFEVTPDVSGNFWAVTEDGNLARFVDGSKSLAWKNLKDVVNAVQEGDTIIIANTIKATDDSGNKGEIRIDKNLTIQGNTGKTSDILDADGKNRIFSVANGKTLTLKNLTLENGSGDYGGGIRADSNCTLTMTGCILKGNKVNRLGGGIYASNTTITMKDCTLTGNVAHEPSGTASGGGIYADNNKMVTIENCTFTGNKGDYGGCIRTDSSIITLTIKNCTFTGNNGRFGGCIYAANSTVTIEGGSIGGTDAGKANNATDSGGSGGGLYIGNNTTLTLKNCTVTGNTALEKGGSVYVTGYNAKLIMEGSTTITPAADKNDVYLENDKMITVNDMLFPQGGTAARITPAAYSTTTKVLDGSKVGTEHTKFTVTSNGSEQWKIDSDGKLKRK